MEDKGWMLKGALKVRALLEESLNVHLRVWESAAELEMDVLVGNKDLLFRFRSRCSSSSSLSPVHKRKSLKCHVVRCAYPIA